MKHSTFTSSLNDHRYYSEWLIIYLNLVSELSILCFFCLQIRFKLLFQIIRFSQLFFQAFISFFQFIELCFNVAAEPSYKIIDFWRNIIYSEQVIRNWISL